MNPTDMVSVPVYSDGDRPVAYLSMRYAYLEQIARESQLDSFILESVSFYACVEGPVLVIQGEANGRHSIRGLTVPVDGLSETSAIRRAWEENKAKEMTIGSVHNSILEALANPAN